MNGQVTQAWSEPMDDAELRAFLERHHAVSYGWALSCCARDAVEAEDVLQTVYLKILAGRARFDGRSAFKTWLFAVIRTTAADERRRNWLRRLRLAARTREQQHQAAVATDDPLDQSERLTAFQQALSGLPRRQREILHLVFYQDMSLQEAAEVLGVSVGSARTHYDRGKRRFRQWLEQSEYFDEYRRDRQPAKATVS